MEERAAVVECSTTFLAHILRLPKDLRIARIEQSVNDYYSKKFKLVLEGPSLPPVAEAELLPRVNLEFHDDGAATRVKF